MSEMHLIAKLDDGYTFYISPRGTGCVLSVEPANRFNGTQSFDGRFPRTYTKPQYAKAALTKYLGEAVNWERVKGEDKSQ